MQENRTGRTASVVSELESTLDSVDVAEEIVTIAARELGFAEDDQYRIGMAIRESVVNAVVHGNCYSRNKKVRLGVRKDADRLTITVADEGKGLDLASLPDPLATENLLNQSGRGIFLIKAFMDEFEVRKLEPIGTEFKLVKYLDRKL
ncbi:MAG: ATP-binding protein [Bryobacteraceae bacterium]|nr:ATP-binding protein [Bryobacteraceae bacterium]